MHYPSTEPRLRRPSLAPSPATSGQFSPSAVTRLGPDGISIGTTNGVPSHVDNDHESAMCGVDDEDNGDDDDNDDDDDDDDDDGDGDDDDDDDDDDRTMVALLAGPNKSSSLPLSLILASVPVPIPATETDEHLVQVHAVALTRGELTWADAAAVRPTSVPGYEFSGTVVLAPSRSSPFQPGTEVYACTSRTRAGNAREYTLARTDEMCQRPETLSWEEAATVPLSALTAWQALFVHGGLALPETTTTATTRVAVSSPPSACALQQLQRLQQLHLCQPTPPDPSLSTTQQTLPPCHRLPRTSITEANSNRRVLITAAAGGVGLWAVQLARLAGVGHITATCGPDNVDFVKSLGAHRVMDYTAEGVAGMTCPLMTSSASSASTGRSTPPLPPLLSPLDNSGSHTSTPLPPVSATASPGRLRSGKYDLVLDCVGGPEAVRRAWMSARHGGTVISVATPAEPLKPASGVGMDVKSVWFAVQPDSAQLQAVTDLVEARVVKAVFDAAYPPEQYAAALARAESGHLRGKVVVRFK